MARGLESLLFVCVLIFSTWLFFHFTNAPIPPPEESVSFSTPGADGGSSGEYTSSRRSSYQDATAPERPEESPLAYTGTEPPPRSVTPQLPAPTSAAADPATRTTSDAGRLPAPPSSPRDAVPQSSPPPGPAATRAPLAVQMMSPGERAELEASVQRGLTRFGYDPGRPDIEGVAARIAADPAVLDLAATIGLTSADVHWLALDYLTRRTASGASTSPTRLERTPIAPRTLEPTNR